MMGLFHIRPLPTCRGVGFENCGKAATVEIFNNRNASYGAFCKKCGDRQLKVLNESYKDVDPATMPRK